jgi:LDH2 family malate/lactate/ureidoglycolate dehydrogenase
MVQVDPVALKGFVAKLLESAGSVAGEAAIVSDHLVEASHAAVQSCILLQGQRLFFYYSG